MKIKSKACAPSVLLIAFSLSAGGVSPESNQIRTAISESAMLGITLYNSASRTSVLDGNIEPSIESIVDYAYPKAKRTYKMKVRISQRSKGKPTSYGNYIF